MTAVRFLLLFLISAAASSASAAVAPISDRHRSAASELFTPISGSFGSLEEAYEAAKTFQILGIGRSSDLVESSCAAASEAIVSSASTEPKDLLYALRVRSVLGCKIEKSALQAAASRLQLVLKDAKSLLDLYYTIGGLVLVKEYGGDVVLSNADGVFHTIKSFGQSDGKWRYSTDAAESSVHASGLALEALAGVISLAGNDVDQSTVGIVKNDIVKLFDSIKSYDDGSLYFDDELIDVSKYQGPLSTTASVVRGLAKFAFVVSGRINIPGDKILGIANFFLNIGIPGSTTDFFNQIDSLSFLENNRVYIPLVLSLPSAVLSSTRKDQLKVKVTTVFGSAAPPLTVNLESILPSGSKGKPLIENQELKYDSDQSVHVLDIISKDVDVGKYLLSFKILFHEAELEVSYATGSQTRTSIFVTGFINIDNAEISILDADVGSVDTKKRLELSGGHSLALSANHLQKLQLSFQLTTPLGHSFKPHQAFLKMIHETKVEHIFMLDNSGKDFSITLNFLRLVDKFYYLSGRYDLQLAVGDAVMENSFTRVLGHVELDLPDAPEKASQAPPQVTDPYLRFGPKSEISHIFRAPEKRPPKELSYTFFVVTLLPLLGFVVGLTRLGVNMKNFPLLMMPATFSMLFHLCIAAVLLLYVLFWLKLDLFTTLKYLSILGTLLIFIGHGALSHLAAASTKLKSS